MVSTMSLVESFRTIGSTLFDPKTYDNLGKTLGDAGNTIWDAFKKQATTTGELTRQGAGTLTPGLAVTETIKQSLGNDGPVDPVKETPIVVNPAVEAGKTVLTPVIDTVKKTAESGIKTIQDAGQTIIDGGKSLIDGAGNVLNGAKNWLPIVGIGAVALLVLTRR